MQRTRTSFAISRLIVGILALSLAVYFADVGSLYRALTHLTLQWIVVLALLAVILVLVSAIKWRLFLHELAPAEAVPPSLATLFGLYLVGYFVNLVLPSYLGGDAVRSYYVGRTVGQHEAAAATILERYTGLVAMLGLALGVMWLSELATPGVRITVILLSVAVVLGTVAALSSRLLIFLEQMPVVGRTVSHLRKVQTGLLFARGRPRLLIATALLSVVYHSCTVLNTLAAAYAVGWTEAPIAELFVVLPLILLIGAIPISPQGLGLQEGAFLYFLSGIGAMPAQALALGLVLRAKSYVLALIGGIFWMVENRAGRIVAPQLPSQDS